MLKELVLAILSFKQSFRAACIPDKDIVCGDISIDSEAAVVGVGASDCLGSGEAEVSVPPVNETEGFTVQVISVEDAVNCDLVKGEGVWKSSVGALLPVLS